MFVFDEWLSVSWLVCCFILLIMFVLLMNLVLILIGCWVRLVLLVVGLGWMMLGVICVDDVGGVCVCDSVDVRILMVVVSMMVIGCCVLGFIWWSVVIWFLCWVMEWVGCLVCCYVG